MKNDNGIAFRMTSRQNSIYKSISFTFTFLNGLAGIFITLSGYNNITNNYAHGNRLDQERGVYLYNFCDENVVANNSFIGQKAIGIQSIKSVLIK